MPNSDTQSNPGPLESQLREMYGRVAYTHKTHLKMADALLDRNKRVKLLEIGLSALTSSALLLAIFGESRGGTIVGAILSTVLLGVVLYVKEENMGEEGQRHTETAAKLWGLREGLLSLLTDLRGGRPEPEIRAERDEINQKLEIIYKAAPRTNGKAYAASQHALKNAEELYFSNSELDHLLPPALRVGEPKSPQKGPKA